MRKILLIVFLYSLVSGTAWAEGLIGKGVICEGIDEQWHPQVWFFDDDRKIHHIDFDNSRIEGLFVSEKTSYGNNAKFIIWTSIYANSNFVLSRKTLKLKLQQWDNNQSKTVYFYYQEVQLGTHQALHLQFVYF